MKRLENKSAIITGGAGGIGKSAAQRFIEEGAKVLLVDLDEEELKSVAEDLDQEAVHYMAADVSKAGDVETYAGKAKELFGSVDIFFNNAGIEGDVQPITEYKEETFDKVISVNVKGVWLGMKYVIPVMKENGSIIITSSVAGFRGTANVSAYVASKHATIGIMKTAALELAPKKIRVNTVNPAPVDNRMMRSLEEGFSDDSEQAKDDFESMIPLGRYAKNIEIANVALFLATDESSYVTGGVYPVDGGMTTA